MNTQDERTIQLFAYFGFVLVGIINVAFLDSYALGACFIALAIIFEPFGQHLKWQEKPISQKLQILGHLAVALALIGYALFVLVR
jgi:nitrate reductase NapE component